MTLETTPPTLKNPLLMLDYDGTLAAIVNDPTEAAPHEDVPELLKRLGERYPVYIITGRQVKDLSALLDVPSLHVMGVHGMEEGPLGGEVTPLVSDEALEALEEARQNLPDVPGVRVEDKGTAIALHYRSARDEEGIEGQLRAWVEGLPERLEPLWGKKLLEVRPKGYSKGKAVEGLVASHPDTTPLFLGDDTTDEEAFAVIGERGISIKVGEGETKARYRLEGIEAVVAYLRGYL